MNEETAGKKQDRKLGDEWTDWDGELDAQGREIDEKPTTFYALGAAVFASFLVLIVVGWFLVEPRIAQIHFVLAVSIGWLIFGGIVALIAAVLIEAIALIKFKVSLFPYAWIEKTLLIMLPKAIWLGTKLGISKDRVGNSFIKVHNLITARFVTQTGSGKLLVLLPRCLKKEARTELLSRFDQENVKICTVAGGEEARSAIRQHRPSSILAIACERDLMSGIKDVAEKIPVLAVPNKRPEGPCKNTDLSLPELEGALKALNIVKRAA